MRGHAETVPPRPASTGKRHTTRAPQWLSCLGAGSRQKTEVPTGKDCVVVEGYFVVEAAFFGIKAAVLAIVVEAVVRMAGASSAVTCDPGVVTRGVNLQRLPRRFVVPASRSAV